jgi:ribonuclease HI
VLETTSGGPDHGIFVGASCDPNPGPGGWAVVRVLGGAVVREVFGEEPATTSSRMELRAVIEGMRMALPTERVTVYSSSQTVVNTLKDWAPAWARNGWRRGPRRERVSNLDLVAEAYRTYLGRPNATVAWLASDGPSKWARYAHALARSYLLGAA